MEIRRIAQEQPRDTMAVAEAASAAMAMRRSNRRASSSSTKTAPAIGALKAVARPRPRLPRAALGNPPR